MGDIIATGDFDEMVELASELATDEDSQAVIHKEFCTDPIESETCPCQPLVMSPYTPITKTEIVGPIH